MFWQSLFTISLSVPCLVLSVLLLLSLSLVYSVRLSAWRASSCSGRAHCRMKMGSFVLEPDTWEADLSCWKFKHSGRHDAPWVTGTNTKTLQRQTSLSFFLPAEFQGQGCPCGPPSFIIIPLLTPLFLLRYTWCCCCKIQMKKIRAHICDLTCFLAH